MEERIEISAFPFRGRTIKEVIAAGSEYEIHVTNHGHSYEILMNQDIIAVDNYDKSLMAFIKFVEEEIRNCSKDYDAENLTPEQVNEITEFISLILDRIAQMVSTLNKDGERPTPSDIRSCLGQKASYGDVYLYDIIELIMNAQGYMHVPGTFDKIAKINFVPNNLLQAIEKKIQELINPNISYGSK